MEQEQLDKPDSKPNIVLKKAPINWRAVFAESAFIGASILIAFALQDWDEEKDIEERTLIALCNVKSELAFNRVLIKSEYVPRQRGMLALANASLTQISAQPDAEFPKVDFKSLQVQEPLRFSAWTLAGESGYLLHANFQLATEIGALFDYQQDKYHKSIAQVDQAVSRYEATMGNSTLEHYATIATSISAWTAQTTFLEEKYESLFTREDFNQLDCET